MVNFYRRFIPNSAEAGPSPSPVIGGQNGPVERSNEKLYVFERLKSYLAKAKALAFPNPDTVLWCDLISNTPCKLIVHTSKRTLTT